MLTPYYGNSCFINFNFYFRVEAPESLKTCVNCVSVLYVYVFHITKSTKIIFTAPKFICFKLYSLTIFCTNMLIWEQCIVLYLGNVY